MAPGRVKEKVVPLPGAEAIHILPRCRSIIFLQIARPRPCPS